MATDLDLQGQIWFKKSNFLVSPLLEILNHHITTREPWVPRLLHKPDYFMVLILCAYLYTYTVSQSRLFHSLNTLHAYWSRQPRVFRRLPSLLLLMSKGGNIYRISIAYRGRIYFDPQAKLTNVLRIVFHVIKLKSWKPDVAIWMDMYQL